MFNIIPQPVSIIINRERKGFTLHSGTTVTPYDFSEDFIGFVRRALNKKVQAKEDMGEEKSIILKIDDRLEHPEGYTLRCENRRVVISAKTDTGLFYGLQTLRQLLLQTDGKIPYVEITDYPRFSYRGYMLDCGRYFYSVDDIKRIADLMALHKLNVLHWHLTEDQGWRVEIKKYPLLTEKGSRRSHTNFNSRPHGGYYTQEDIREIVAYCHERKIKVIPEFDIPGHSVAAIACYPQLSCFDRELEVATHWGVKHDILCAGKESTYEFVFGVLDELMELFPDGVIHIGGDEAVKTRWKICPHCQAEMKRLGLKNEEELQTHFMTRINAYLKEHGFSSLMWHYDLPEDYTAENDIGWMVCGSPRNREYLKAEAAGGRKIINSSSFAYYLDFPYGWTSIKRVCEFDGSLTDDDGDLWGIEGCMWTEYVPNMKRLEFLTFPRLGAVAEAAWAEKGSQSFSSFIHKAQDYRRLLDVFQVNYAKLKTAHPNFIYKRLSSLWFRRRVLHWQGIHNLIDDNKVKKLAKK